MDITRALLDFLIANGSITLAVVAFLCALGIPLPIPLLLIAVGALVRQGELYLLVAVFLTVAGALLGETLLYAIGREVGPRVRHRAGARFGRIYDEAERRFKQHPGLAVYLTRWLFPPLAIPTNLIAGASCLPLARFAASAVLGNLMWISLYTAMGYALGNEWSNVSPVLDRYKVYFAGAAVILGLLFLAWKMRQRVLQAAQEAAAAAHVAADAASPKAVAPEPATVRDHHAHQR